jgi:hypothetical protein
LRLGAHCLDVVVEAPPAWRPGVAGDDESSCLEHFHEFVSGELVDVPVDGRDIAADRADIISAGIAVVVGFMAATGKRVVHVSGGGVREGVILEMAAARK